MSESLHRSFRLLPSERVLWHGKPRLGVSRQGVWVVVPASFIILAVIVALFAGLIAAAGIPAVRSTAFLAFYLLVTGIAAWFAPRAWLDSCEYLITDRHVIWKRGQVRRVIDRSAISYGRIRWHQSEPGVGSLELVRAAPFGPLSRRQRLLLHDLEAPDRVYSLIRGTEPTDFAGYGDLPLTDRLDRGEQVLWGSAPAGYRIGRSELITSSVGTVVLAVGLLYGHRMANLLLDLERVGLPVQSWTWLLLFLAIVISALAITGVGAWLVWRGLWGSRAAGSSTEYILTDTRVLIRRGETELSVDRRRIVDIAELPCTGDLRNLFLILDGLGATALDDSGALSILPPPRAAVLPVLYEVRDRELFRRLLFSTTEPPLRDAA
ncbi:MAG TPA: hypothetical protein VFG30_06575 [Polyangiales bacterium]|nr:hypothetical protein [Polyangiales bacterium]